MGFDSLAALLVYLGGVVVLYPPVMTTTPAELPNRGRSPGTTSWRSCSGCGIRRAGLRFITVINNNYVGVFYVGTALLFFVLRRRAGAADAQRSWRCRTTTLIGPDLYNQLFTMHGTVMMFLFAVPAVEAMGVLLLPQHAGRARPAVPAAVGLRLLGLPRRRPGVLLQPVLRPGAARRLVHVPAADQRRILAGHQRRLLAAGHRLHRDLGHRRRHRDRRRRAAHPRAGHDAGAHAGVRLGDAGVRA